MPTFNVCFQYHMDDDLRFQTIEADYYAEEPGTFTTFKDRDGKQVVSFKTATIVWIEKMIEVDPLPKTKPMLQGKVVQSRFSDENCGMANVALDRQFVDIDPDPAIHLGDQYGPDGKFVDLIVESWEEGKGNMRLGLVDKL